MKSGQTKLTIADLDDFDFSKLDGQTDVVELILENLSNLQRLDQLPLLPNLKALTIASCPNLVSLQGTATPELTELHIRHCESLTDYAPLNEFASLENLTIHTTHPSLNGLRRADRPNLTLFVTVEDEGGSYQKCFRSENDFQNMKRDAPELKKFIEEN